MKGKTAQERQKAQHLTSGISLFKNTVGFNLLTALAGSSPTKLGVVSLAAAKVINGAIPGGKPGHRIFSSLSHLVMIFHKKWRVDCYFPLHFFFLNEAKRRKGGKKRWKFFTIKDDVKQFTLRNLKWLQKIWSYWGDGHMTASTWCVRDAGDWC